MWKSKTEQIPHINYPQMGEQPYYPSAYQTPKDYSRDSLTYKVAVKNRISKSRRALIMVVAICLAVIVGGGTAFAMYVNYLSDNLNRGDKTAEELASIGDALAIDHETPFDEVFYMMLLGSDTREGGVSGFGRSDSNIVVRVDAENKQLSMLSIPRDTKIQLAGHGTQKFNAAYAFEGAAGAIKAAEDLLDIEISHYAEVSFADLAGLVDAVGGITVENESRINNPKCDDGDGNHYIIEKGTVTLNGGEALTFARNRDYPDGDFTRQRHQRAVVEAIIGKVITAPLTSIPGIVDAGVKCVTTDLSVTDILELAQYFANSNASDAAKSETNINTPKASSTNLASASAKNSSAKASGTKNSATNSANSANSANTSNTLAGTGGSKIGGITIYSCMLPSYPKNINGISFVIVDEEKADEMIRIFKAGGDPSVVVSTGEPPASAAEDVEEDTSNVVLFDDDEAVVSGSANSYTPSSSYNYNSSQGSSGSWGGDSGGNSGYQPPDPGSSGGDSGSGSESGGAGGSGDGGSAGGDGGSSSGGDSSGDSGSSGESGDMD